MGQTSAETKEKRKGGQVKDHLWLVLTESTGCSHDGYIHHCGTEVASRRVLYPIWDGPFPCSGSGKCHSQEVPFCPKCEEEPASSGAPIVRSS